MRPGSPSDAVPRSRTNSIGMKSSKINTSTTNAATFHHISSSSRKQSSPYRHLKGFPVTALIVVNGIRGQQISFMYPSDDHIIHDDGNHQQSQESSENSQTLQSSSQSVNNNPSSNLNNANGTSIHTEQSSANNSAPNSLTSSSLATGTVSVSVATGTGSQPNQHLVSHPQVVDRYENAFGLNSAALSYLLCPPKNSIIDKLTMSMTIDNLLFISRPASIQTRKLNITDINIANPSAYTLKSSGGDYTHFTIAFVFPSHTMTGNNEQVFSHLLTLLMKSYIREQQRCGYVLEQLNLLGKLKDDSKNWKDLAIRSYESSLLAKELITIVDSIRQANPLQIRINGWIEVGYKMPKRMHHHTHETVYHQLHDFLSKNKPPTVVECKGEKVKPYNACIFVNDLPKLKIPHDGLQELQGNESILRVFNNPTKTIGEISKESNLNLNFVLSLVQHLVDWGVIRIVPKISYSTMLTINEHPDNTGGDNQCPLNDWFPPPEHVVHEFSKRFVSFPHLIEILELFSTSRSCRAHIDNISKLQTSVSAKTTNAYLESSPTTYYPTVDLKSKKKTGPTSTSSSAVSHSEQYMMCILWLLRKGYIRVCNTYYQLVIPHNIHSKSFTRIPGSREPMSPSTPPAHITFSPPVRDHITVEFCNNEANDETLSNCSSSSSSPKSSNFKKYLSVKIPYLDNYEINNDSQFRTLSVYEMDYIKSICDDDHSLELFKKLYFYLNGEYSEREIIHQNNISREDFKRLLKSFNEVILSYTI